MVLTLSYQHRIGGHLLETFEKCSQWVGPKPNIAVEDAPITLEIVDEDAAFKAEIVDEDTTSNSEIVDEDRTSKAEIVDEATSQKTEIVDQNTVTETEIVDEDPSPQIKIVGKETIKVTVSLKAIPTVMEESRLNIVVPDVSDECENHALSLCIERKCNDSYQFLSLGYFGIIYQVLLCDKDYTKFADANNDKIEVTIEGESIIATSTYNQVKLYRDLTTMEVEGLEGNTLHRLSIILPIPGIWSALDIRMVAPGVQPPDRKVDVGSVKCLALCQDELQYTMADMREAIKIMEVAKSLHMSGASLPDCMGQEDWEEAAENAGRVWRTKVVIILSSVQILLVTKRPCM